MFITLPSKLAMLVYVAGLLIWSDGLFIFWTYHTPHMISVFLCSRILGTLICIWNNGRRYSICCFTILHIAISLSYRCLEHIWMLSQIVDNLHVDRYWVLYQVPVCDMGYFLSLSGVGLPLFWMDIWVPIFRCENAMTSWTVLLHIIYSKQRFSLVKKK